MTTDVGIPTVGTVERSESITRFSAAFVKAQAAISSVAKDKTNPHYNSRYADLASVDAAVRPALNANGIAVIQTPASAGANKLGLTTMLLHESGEYISGTGEIDLGRNGGPQAYGSAMTYARRYFLAAMTGVCPEDDDGNAAHGNAPANGRQQPVQRQAPPRQPAKPAPAQSDPDADEKFSIALTEACESRGFNGPAKSRMLQATCGKYGLTNITELPDLKRREMLKAIADGKMDTFKKEPQS